MLPSLLLITIPELLTGLALSALTDGPFMGPCYRLLWAIGRLPIVGAQISVSLGLALVIVPWLLADRGIGLREALPERWRLAHRRPRDVLIFTLRYMLLFVAADGIIGFIPLTLDSGFSPGGLVWSLLYSALWLTIVLAIGMLYEHLKSAGTEVAGGSQAMPE